MIEFHKYPKIENHKSIADKVLQHPCGSEQWIATEKIHGCNLSFLTDGTGVKIARRSAILTPEEYKTFYHVGELMKDIIPKVKQIHNDLNLTEQLIIYGELFGGLYPGYKANKWTKPIQRGIYYCPEIKFCAFDIRIGEKYIDYDVAADIFKKYDIYYAEILFQGNFEQCVEWSMNNYKNITTIPEAFGLEAPVLDNKDFINIREGHVLKPIVHSHFNGGSSISVKHKNDKFIENQQYHGDISKDALFQEIEPYKELLLSLTNQQRLDNVLSKLGDIDILKQNKKNIPKVLHLFTDDIMEEFISSGPELYQLKYKSDEITSAKKTIYKFVMTHASKLVLDLF